MLSNKPFNPTPEQVGRDVSYAPSGTSHLDASSRRARLIGIVSDTHSRIQFYQRRSKDLLEEVADVDNQTLIWFYPVPGHLRNNLGFSDGFSLTLTRLDRFITIDDFNDAAKRLFAGSQCYDSDTGEKYTQEQILQAIWIWFNHSLYAMLENADEYVCSRHHESDVFDDALSVIGGADPARVPEQEEQEASVESGV